MILEPVLDMFLDGFRSAARVQPRLVDKSCVQGGGMILEPVLNMISDGFRSAVRVQPRLVDKLGIQGGGIVLEPTVLPGDITVELQLVARGLTSPVKVVHAGDGSNRIFIADQAGVVWVTKGKLQARRTPFLDITNEVESGGAEQGLLGLAFHPEYSVNGQFYVYYIRDGGTGLDRSVVARYMVSAGDSNIANEKSAITLMEFEQDESK